MDILKSYLVSLGFKVDSGGLRRFNEGVGNASKAAVALGAAVAAAGVAITAAVKRASQDLDDLYFASQRIGASAANIKGLGFALSQVGGDAKGVRQSLENFAEFLRANPNGENFVKSLGVQMRDASGEARDTAEVFNDLGSVLRKLPYYAAQRRASVLGIDDRTLQALLRGDVAKAMAQVRAQYRAAGIDQQRLAREGHETANAFRDLGRQVSMVADKMFLALAPKLLPLLERIGAWAQRNAGTISQRLTDFAVGVWTIGEAVVRFGATIVDWLTKLDTATSGASTALVALGGGFLLLAGAIGAIPAAIAGITAAFIALVDDFNTWKAGGASLFDWSWWDGYAKAIGEAVAEIVGVFRTDMIPALGELATSLGRFGGAFLDLFGKDHEKQIKEFAHNSAVEFGYLARMVTGAADAIRGLAAALRGDWKGAGAAFSDYWHGTRGEGRVGSPAERARANGDPRKGVSWLARLAGYRESTNVAVTPEAAPHGVAFGNNGQPRGLRNNNPSNLRSWGGTPVVDGFARFATMREGVLAGMANLLAKERHGLHTLSTIIGDDRWGWAPARDGNNPAAYARHVAGRIGRGVNERLNLRDPDTLAKVMGAFITEENGRNPIGADVLRQLADQKLGAGERFGVRQSAIGHTVSANTKVDIHVAASPTARETGREVAERVGRVNADVIRYAIPGAR